MCAQKSDTGACWYNVDTFALAAILCGLADVTAQYVPELTPNARGLFLLMRRVRGFAGDLSNPVSRMRSVPEFTGIARCRGSAGLLLRENRPKIDSVPAAIPFFR